MLIDAFIMFFKKLFGKTEEISETSCNRYVTIEMESWLKVSKDNPMIKDVTKSCKLKNWQERLKYKVWKLRIDGYVYIAEQITPFGVSIGLDENDKAYILKAKTINKWIMKNFKPTGNYNYIFSTVVHSTPEDFAATCNSFTRMLSYMAVRGKTLSLSEIYMSEKDKVKRNMNILGL